MAESVVTPWDVIKLSREEINIYRKKMPPGRNGIINDEQATQINDIWIRKGLRVESKEFKLSVIHELMHFMENKPTMLDPIDYDTLSTYIYDLVLEAEPKAQELTRNHTKGVPK